MTATWLALLLDVPPAVAEAVAAEATLLEAGGCPFCCARSLLVLLGESSAPVVARMRRELARLHLFGPACEACSAERRAA